MKVGEAVSCFHILYWPPACHFLRTIFTLHRMSALFLLLPSTLSHSCKNRPGVWPLSFRFWFSFSVIDLQGLTEAAVCKLFLWSFLIAWPWCSVGTIVYYFQSPQQCCFLFKWRKTQMSEIVYQHNTISKKEQYLTISYASLAQITHTKKCFSDHPTYGMHLHNILLFFMPWDYNKFFSDCVLAVVKHRPLIAFNAAVLQSLCLCWYCFLPSVQHCWQNIEKKP